ncbi:MAG: hypothetical protein NW200_04215 [Hyphomonadaceae bacterium]|nr:hypothetical protein [Hyphomonadaceae bacterium]
MQKPVDPSTPSVRRATLGAIAVCAVSACALAGYIATQPRPSRAVAATSGSASPPEESGPGLSDVCARRVGCLHR